jgi:hypothetical protein
MTSDTSFMTGLPTIRSKGFRLVDASHYENLSLARRGAGAGGVDLVPRRRPAAAGRHGVDQHLGRGRRPVRGRRLPTEWFRRLNGLSRLEEFQEYKTYARVVA